VTRYRQVRRRLPVLRHADDVTGNERFPTWWRAARACCGVASPE